MGSSIDFTCEIKELKVQFSPIPVSKFRWLWTQI